MMVDDNWISNAPIFNYLRHPYRNMANYKKIMSEKDIAVDENISKLTQTGGARHNYHAIASALDDLQQFRGEHTKHIVLIAKVP